VSDHCERPPGGCDTCAANGITPEYSYAQLHKAAREFIDAERDYAIDRMVRNDAQTNWPIFARYLLKRDVLTRMVTRTEEPT
jgi:hypothetical protein